MHSYEYFGQRVIRGKKITIKKSLFVNNHFFMFSEIQNVHLACISKLTSARDVDHGRRLFSRHGATLPNRNPKPDKSYEIVRSLVRERERERERKRGMAEKGEEAPGMSAIIPGWFSEISPMWPGSIFYLISVSILSNIPGSSS